MTYEEFMQLVAKMRHMQKKYFKSPDVHVLVECRKLETQVDYEIDNYQQLKLF